MALSENEEYANEPRKVKLKRRKQSFGFKVRGQVSQGGPRWLINGREYKNLQTVSEVLPESAAEDVGVLPGDKVVSINGMDIEGIEHERFKELMKNSGDEVELVVITPKDAKMLDIPASVTIHKSDGSTLSITDPDVLQNQNIDEAIQNEEKKAKMTDVQVHNSTIVEIDPEDIANVDEEAEGQEECNSNEATGSCIDANDDPIEAQEENQDESKSSHCVSVDMNGLLEEQEQNDGSMVDDNDSNHEHHVDILTDTEQLEGVASQDLETDPTSEESSTTSNAAVIVDMNEMEETSFIETNTKDEDLQAGRDSVVSSCTCAQETRLSDNAHIVQSGRLVKQGRRGQRRLLPKRPKLRPFSPDIFNNLAPYYSKPDIKSLEMDERPARSWKYSQRPTSLSVLHPSDAHRLESDHFQQDIIAWSSNLAKKRAHDSDKAVEDEPSRLRHDIYKMHRSVTSRSVRSGNVNRAVSQKKLTELSRQFTTVNGQRTLKTYLGLT